MKTNDGFIIKSLLHESQVMNSNGKGLLHHALPNTIFDDIAAFIASIRSRLISTTSFFVNPLFFKWFAQQFSMMQIASLNSSPTKQPDAGMHVWFLVAQPGTATIIGNN